MSDEEFDNNNAIYKTLLWDSGLRLAPAEGYSPTSILFDKNSEYLAFPKIYGGYKLNPRHDGLDIPYSEVAKSIVMRYDRRVAERGDYLLYIAKKLELIKLKSNIAICLRKKYTSENKVTAKQLLNGSYVSGLIQHNDGFKILKNIRSSAAHWQNEKVKLLAMIRQFGLPTLFITLSAADTRWPELLVELSRIVDQKKIRRRGRQSFIHRQSKTY